MTEPRLTFTYDGQEIEQTELGTAIDNGAYADDRVLDELLRMTPLSPAGGAIPSRGIMPWGVSGGVDANHPMPVALLAPNGATGSVKVAPFRAFVGSRTLEATDALKNWRDVRSALSVLSGSTSLALAVSFGANASGNPRWDRVVAAVSIDQAAAQVTRFVKDTTTDQATPKSVSVAQATSVSLQVVAGTPAASPVPPAVPADTSNTYFISLGEVLIPNGFTAGSTVLKSQICTDAPLVGLEPRAAGALAFQPIDYSRALTAAQFQAWGSASRPSTAMPSTARGGTIREIALDLIGSPPTNNSVIDSSIDWRGRRFFWMLVYDTANAFPWEPSAGPGAGMFNGTPMNPASSVWGYGQSDYSDSAAVSASFANAHSTILGLTGGTTGPTNLVAGKTVYLVVDQTTGNLCVGYTGTPSGKVYILLVVSPQFENDRNP